MGLINSLIIHEKNPFELYIICLDEFTRILLKKLNFSFVHLIPLHEIEYRDQGLINARSNRSLVEYYWTLTPSVIMKILENNPHIPVLTYLDADLFFYSSPDPIWNELGNNSIMIHEHRFSPEQKSLEIYGKYNVGLLCFRNDQRAMTVLNWWRTRCNEWCYARLEKDRYGDQLYLNQFPIRFEGVTILKHIGAGVGPWNHIQYQFSKNQDGQVFVDGYPLVFYHFHSLTFVDSTLIIPSKFISNPFTMDILSFCVIPYVDKLLQHIQEIRLIHPDFTCGLINKNMLTVDRMFIGHKSIRPKIEQSNLPHEFIPMDGHWDCYATPQFRKQSPSFSQPSSIKEVLPVPTGKKQTPPDLILDQAEQELQRGNSNIAVQMLKAIIQKWPNYYLAYNDLGIIHWKAGDKKHAFEYLKHAYEINPFDSKIVTNLVKILLNLHEAKAAENIISHYMERFPADLEMRDLRYKIVKPIMLNLGCGNSYHKDWVNIDIHSTGPDVIAHNLFLGIPYGNDSVDVVYHSHVLEHMPKQYAPEFLKECFRVLKKGGIIRIAIPDLEKIVREYLVHLENALDGDEDAANRYEWILLELLDQTVRNQSGGEMIEYWKQNPMPAESYVYERCGLKVSNAVTNLRRQNILPRQTKDIFTHVMQHPNDQLLMQMARFRTSGEVHQWMYDRYSLKLLLQQAGFSDIRVCMADESFIKDFKSYQLDSDDYGNTRKPDSLFMEARKF